MKNKIATRDFSDEHEKSVCKALNARQVPNSGAGLFTKGDCIIDSANMLVECKCSMSEKKSFSIKKEWLEKMKEEQFANRLDCSSLCFNFEPNGKNYYVIDESLMKYLVECLENS